MPVPKPLAPVTDDSSATDRHGADVDAVRRFYDRNTAAFVAFGQGHDVGAIHRAVWGPGVTTESAAFHFVEDEIARALETLAAPEPLHVIDLGCGVGASLTYLATRLPLRGTGVTLSPVQVRAATQRIATMGLGDRVRVVEGSYTALPSSIGVADAAYAIESFVHGPDASRFFAEAARVIKPGGLLAVCDDIARPSPDPAAARTLARFCRGWHVHSLVTALELQRLADDAGFAHVSTTDLTPWLQLGRLRDVLIDLAMPLIAWLPLADTRLGHLDGGRALQRALKRGWLGYDLTLFTRR